MRNFSPSLPWVVAASLLGIQAPGAAQAPAPSTPSVAADLQMAQDAEPFRRAADAFVASALAGNSAQVQAMLSPALVTRIGEATHACRQHHGLPGGEGMYLAADVHLARASPQSTTSSQACECGGVQAPGAIELKAVRM